jgi:predicted MFS family arabinose efflux permease
MNMAMKRASLWRPAPQRYRMSTNIAQSAKAPGISTLLTLLFAVSGGAAVGNLYWAQPLLADIAQSFGVSAASAGSLVTTTQIGYAIGIILIVPLGDVLNRRRLIPVVMGCSALALVACAMAPSFTMLLISLAAVGITTVSGQIITPLAGDLARPEQRGKVVGTIVSGLISGILLSRTISGFVADAFGWRAIYWLAAVIVALLAVTLSRVVPQDMPRSSLSYRKLLASIIEVVGRHKAAQVSLIISGIAFCVFTMFWTGLTFLLSAAPFSYSVTQIGLVGLVGVAGAMAARRAGVFHDRGMSARVSGLALLGALISLVIANIGSAQIWGILLAVLLLDIAIQTVNVLNQTRLLALEPNARSRLNTAYVACNFIGGAIGSALAGVLWVHGGWNMMTICAGILVAIALAIWGDQRHRLGPRK